MMEIDVFRAAVSSVAICRMHRQWICTGEEAVTTGGGTSI
jgi:hypothetical protein